MAEKILEMKNIVKTFPGVKALDHAYIDLYAGEVNAFLGENGAGKSTLMKVLTGVYQKDEGFSCRQYIYYKRIPRNERDCK